MRLKNHLQKEVLLASGAVLLVLVLIFTSQQFVRFLGDVVNGKIAPELLLSMVFLQLPPLVGFLLPLALFLGVLISFGQLYVDNELTVARSVGVGNGALAKMLLPIALWLAVFSAIFSLWVAPWAASQQQQLLHQQSSKSELSFLTPGKFQISKDGKGVMYAASMNDDGDLTQLFFAELPDAANQHQWQVISAQQGAARSPSEQENFLVLSGGVSYSLPEASSAWGVTAFDSYTMRIPAALSKLQNQKVKAVSTSQLLSDLSNTHWAELHWRLSVPISLPLLLLIAVPLSRVQPRQGKFAKMLPALMLYLSYMILMILSRGMIEDAKLPGWLGFWWIYAVFSAYCLWQYRHPNKKSSFKRKSRGAV